MKEIKSQIKSIRIEVNRIGEQLDSIEKKIKESKPEFKVGDWVVTNRNNNMFKITTINNCGLINGLGYTGISDFYQNWESKSLRHATKDEIESHLKKICDEKYIGKRVKGISNMCWDGVVISGEEEPYRMESDEFWMTLHDGSVACVYKKGKFAEIIPSKKKLPKTKEELVFLIQDMLINQPTGYDTRISLWIESRLKDYED